MIPRRLPGFIAILLWVVFGLFLRADGKVFRSDAVPAEVRMPDQRALLCWSNGVERLVIETRFAGAGTNFAWVLPLPAVPLIEATTTGLLPTVAQLTGPTVKHGIPGVWVAGSFLGGLLWLLLTLKPKTEPRLADLAAALALGAGYGGFGGPGFGVAAFLMTLFGVYRVRIRGAQVMELPALLLIIVLLSSMLLPAISSAGKQVSHAGGVELHGRQTVGIFETTILSGGDPLAVREWLRRNGYEMPPEAGPVIADYVRDGWVFVASRIRSDATTDEVRSIHPLRFTFPAKQPVYPMRLTGVGNDHLDVDLYVFGDDRAHVAGFETRRCQRIEGATAAGVPRKEVFPMRHLELRASTADASVMTRLEGRLDAAAMRRDAIVEWEPFAEEQFIRYSRRGALTLALNWSVCLFALWTTALAAVSKVRSLSPEWSRSRSLGGLVVCLTLGGAVYFPLPVIEVRDAPYSSRFAATYHQRRLVENYFQTEGAKTNPASLDETRNQIEALLKEWPAVLKIREEDSPYNYKLQVRSNRVRVEFNDQYGGASEKR
jgi:hypothetical protein